MSVLREFVGVKGYALPSKRGRRIFDPSDLQLHLKQESLIFDRFVIYHEDPTSARSLLEDPVLEYLHSEGIFSNSLGIDIIEPKQLDPNQPETRLIQRAIPEIMGLSRKLQGLSDNINYNKNLPANEKELLVDKYDKMAKEYNTNIYYFHELRMRLIALTLQTLHDTDAVCIFPSLPVAHISKTVRADVAKIILKALPIPDDKVPWEQIVEFRQDQDTKRKFAALRRWMSKVVREGLVITEIEEELEHLMYGYEAHMKLHRMKFKRGLLQTLLTIPIGLAEDIIKIKWKSAVKSLFSIEKQRIDLLEAELSAPGKEIAYLFKAKNEFLTTHK